MLKKPSTFSLTIFYISKGHAFRPMYNMYIPVKSDWISLHCLCEEGVVGYWRGDETISITCSKYMSPALR
jgi:hypothetical protein